jgi:hypothetical protein
MIDGTSAAAMMRIRFDGGEHEVELRMPAMREIFPLLLPRMFRTPPRMQVLGPAEIQRIVSRVDGRPSDLPAARAIHGDRQAFVQYAAARTRWLEGFIETGVVRAECPHCRAWRADLTLLAYTIGLRVPFPPVADDAGYLELPFLAEVSPRGRRPPDLPLTSRLEFELPCRAQGLATRFSRGAFDRNVFDRESQLWAEWAPAEGTRPDGREQWRDDVPGFRAILRMSAALESLDGVDGPPTPDVVLDLALGDFLFLDNLYHLAYEVPVPTDQGLAVRCERCGGTFLPLL